MNCNWRQFSNTLYRSVTRLCLFQFSAFHDGNETMSAYIKNYMKGLKNDLTDDVITGRLASNRNFFSYYKLKPT